jgi:ligand-binding sensor domain-containing protein/serine phosphatase RsbU (regulator of sigma subunit)
VWCCFEDTIGNIWIGTENGLIKYDGSTFFIYDSKTGFPPGAVYDMVQDDNGNIWFAIEGSGVCKFDGKDFLLYSVEQGLSSYDVMNILKDSKGNIWILTDDAVLNKFDGVAFQHFKIKDREYMTYSFDEDNEGNLWIGLFGGGLCKFDGEKFQIFTTKDGLSDNDVIKVYRDKNNELWLGTYKGGAIHIHENTVEYFNPQNGLSSDRVLTIAEDDVGNIWFGTSGGGLCRLQNHGFQKLDEKDGLSNDRIMSIFEDSKQNIWMGTSGKGLCKYDGVSFTYFQEGNDAETNRFLSIEEDSIGNLWLGTDLGLYKFNGEAFFDYSHIIEGSDNSINDILRDSHGSIWVASMNGVYRIDGDTTYHWESKQGLVGEYVQSLLEDDNGTIWMGFEDGGLMKWDEKSLWEINFSGFKNGVDVSSLCKDKNGRIWIGTANNGVLLMDGGSYRCINRASGLSHDGVISIVDDAIEGVWVATVKGLNYLTLRNGDIEISSFHTSDGLISESFLPNSACRDSKNRFWWGSYKGIVCYDRSRFQMQSVSPKLFLNDIYLQDKFIDFNSIQFHKEHVVDSLPRQVDLNFSFTDVAPFLNYPRGLELPHDINHITFRFSAIDWYDPSKIKYQFKLEGLENDWNTITTENNADYRNIPEGTYIFKVKALGSSGIWSEVLEYPFVVLPPWYRTLWAYGLYALLLFSSLYGFIKWRERSLRQKQKELESKIDEATVEIKEQKKLIEEKHIEITDSILYAERIQRSLLPSDEFLKSNLEEYFVLFQPKDVVSGDFYWATLMNKRFVLISADSTGHGVPGAIMSTLNISCLKEAIQKGYDSPNLILEETRRLVIDNLKLDGSEEDGKDGMDCSLIEIDFNSMQLRCASAYNSIWILRGENWRQIKGDRIPIGKHVRDQEPFTLHTLNLQKGDLIYSFTDGYADQFGGPKGKKLKSKALKLFIQTIAHLPLSIQKIELQRFFSNWKGDLEQLDDVTVVGIRI